VWQIVIGVSKGNVASIFGVEAWDLRFSLRWI
jgi:hypothetical protein